MTDPDNLPATYEYPATEYPATYEYLVPVVQEPTLMSIGDIAITRTHVILPQGRFPLRGSTWTVQDSSIVSESIPVYAIILAIVFLVFCLFGLLFLLIKQTKYSGFISVTVVGDGFYHSVQLPPGPQMAGWVAHQIGQARALAAVA